MSQKQLLQVKKLTALLQLKKIIGRIEHWNKSQISDKHASINRRIVNPEHS